MRPLDRVRSIKVKIGAVIVVAIAMTLLINEVGLALDVSALSRWSLAVLLSLVMVQLMSTGMTSPLREMAAAAREMAGGDYRRQVHVSSRDEVGELARAFTSMATDLAAVDSERKRLVADVSHELRTPLAALQALLENRRRRRDPSRPGDLRDRACADPSARPAGRAAARPVASRVRHGAA